MDGLNSQDQRLNCDDAVSAAGYSITQYGFSGQTAQFAANRSAQDAIFYFTGHAFVDTSYDPEVGYGLAMISPNKGGTSFGNYTCQYLTSPEQAAGYVGTTSGCTPSNLVYGYAWAGGSIPTFDTNLAVLQGCGTFAHTGDPAGAFASFGDYLVYQGHTGTVIGFIRPIAYYVDSYGWDNGPGWSWSAYFWQDLKNGMTYWSAAHDAVAKVKQYNGGSAWGYDSFNVVGDGYLQPARYGR